MTPAGRGPVVALALLAACVGVGAVADSPRADFSRAVAEPALVERVLRESGVEREPPQPSIGPYTGDLAEHLARWLAERLARAAQALRSSGLEPRVVAWAVVALACLALAWVLVRALRRRVAVARPVPAVVTRPVAAGAEARAAERDEWRLELAARLARGDVPAALEALWWWFARSLSGAAVEGSWTSRELLARAGRLDLAPLATSLDRLLYGSTRPGVAEVRRLADDLQAELP